MSTTKRKIVLISSSPKVSDESMSEWLVLLGENNMKDDCIDTCRINVRKSITKNMAERDFKTMLHADALIFVFPLYYFCLPGMLMRFLQDFYQYYNEHKNGLHNAKVYAVVNCGFLEPDINMEAVQVIKSFAEKIDGTFRFGVLIGGGPMIFETKGAPFMKKILRKLDAAFVLMKKEVVDDDKKSIDNIYISVKFPKKIYFFMGGRGWVSLARKNGLKKRELYRKPYRE